MGAFDMLRIAGSSMGAHQTWLDAISDNIANVNTIRSTSGPAFQASTPIVGSRTDGGVSVIGIAQSDPTGVLVYNPEHPLADAQGYVRAPSVDMSSQMTQLIMAQRGFQASVQVTKDAQDTYNAALQIGEKLMSVSGIESVGFSPYVAPTVAPTGPTGTAASSSSSGQSFGDLVVSGIDHLQGVQNNAANLSVQAATGDLNAIHDYTIAATEAAVTTQLTVAMRNKAVEAFTEIMRMPI